MATPLPTELITPATGAQATQQQFRGTKDRLPAMLMATGLAGAEVITVEVSIDGGTTWETYSEGGTAVTLTLAAPTAVLTGAALYGVTKGVTAGAAGCYVSYLDRI